ncbi:hypothetical protein U9M48_033948 [Paspalum notatum var. saurae]|uniref:Uncharacterized protein n=1 Tax=Paspalum notatum var. saurae TaxID=547442 RepID=A0AAQ3U8E3_PASNO
MLLQFFVLYVIKKRARGTTSTNDDPKDQLRPTHDLEAPSVVREEHGISLVTVCPVVVVGAAPAPNARTSVHNCLSLLSGDEAEFRVLRGIEMASGTVALVHVEDVCRAQLFVAEEEAAAGRYLCSSINTTILELASFLADKYPQYTVKTNLLSGPVRVWR